MAPKIKYFMQKFSQKLWALFHPKAQKTFHADDFKYCILYQRETRHKLTIIGLEIYSYYAT